MKLFNYIFLLSSLFVVGACSEEEFSKDPDNNSKEIIFTASLQESSALSTKALGEEKGETVALPYINGIHVRKQESSGSIDAIYHVKNGNKGTLIVGENAPAGTPIKWEDITTAVDFYAWTTPAGVQMEAGDSPTSGTVDFLEGNKKTTNTIDQLNGTAVIPLDVFISAKTAANYTESPTVTLPFYHLVSKLSIHFRNWNYKDITPTSITFYGIKNKWTVQQGGDTKDSLHITTPTDNANPLTLTFANDGHSTTMYLPPLTEKLNTSFATAGDFCVIYGNKEYFGTLSGIKKLALQTTEGELQAGEHMKITMDLSENFGVGVGPTIADWQGPNGEDLIYGPPHKGIYSLEGLKLVAKAINEKTTIPDTLVETIGGVQTIRLYNNIKIPTNADWLPIGNKDTPFTGTFDGQGYTISGINGTTGLFGTTGNSNTTSATIQNLRLSGSIAGTTDGIALLIDTAAHTTVSNCHVIGTSSVTNTGGIAGGLIGIATAGTTISQCSFTGTITGTTIGGLIGSSDGASINNSFVQETGATTPAPINLVGTGTTTLKNSYSVIKKTDAADSEGIVGYYWKEATALEKEAEFNQKGKFISLPAWSWITLIEALNANVDASSSIKWVWVYGKDFPVLQIN